MASFKFQIVACLWWEQHGPIRHVRDLLTVACMRWAQRGPVRAFTSVHLMGQAGFPYGLDKRSMLLRNAELWGFRSLCITPSTLLYQRGLFQPYVPTVEKRRETQMH